MSCHESKRSSSPIYSTRIIVQRDIVDIEPSPYWSMSSDPYSCPSPYMMGNQLEFYKKYGYPELPDTAGQQYLSPQSPSPCVRATSRTTSQKVRIHCLSCVLKLTRIQQNTQLKRDRGSSETESQSESKSPGLRGPHPKRQRMETVVAATDAPFDCAQCVQCAQIQIQELRDFEQRILNLVSQNLEDTQAWLRQEIASLTRCDVSY